MNDPSCPLIPVINAFFILPFVAVQSYGHASKVQNGMEKFPMAAIWEDEDAKAPLRRIRSILSPSSIWH
jgi:hypothetical protein